MAIALGATSVSDIAMLAHRGVLFGVPPSDSTVCRTLQPFDAVLLACIANAHARVRARVWDLIAATTGGFPWLVMAGKVLTGWVVIDLDATVIESSSKEQGAAGTFGLVREHSGVPGDAAAPGQRRGDRQLVARNEDLDVLRCGILARKTRPCEQIPEKQVDQPQRHEERSSHVATVIGTRSAVFASSSAD